MSRQDYVPTWMASLNVIFGITTAVALGVFIYGHVERSAVVEQWTPLKDEIEELRTVEASLADKLPPLDTRIVESREVLVQFGETDALALSDIQTELERIQRIFDEPAGARQVAAASPCRLKTIWLNTVRVMHRCCVRATT